MSEKKKDWLQEAGDYAEERESHLLTAIEEVERMKYTTPDVSMLDQGVEAVLCYLAGALKEARRVESILHRFLEQRAEEKERLRVGDRVKVIANTYRGGVDSDHRGKIGTIMEIDNRGEGYFVDLIGVGCRNLFFETQELEKI